MIRSVETESVAGASTGSAAATGSAADRYCAWAGRGGRRIVFTVRALAGGGEPGETAPGVLLGIRRDSHGRRVVWSTAHRGGTFAPRLHAAVALLRRDGRGELHHCAVAGGPAACDRLLAELALPPLEDGEPLPLAC